MQYAGLRRSPEDVFDNDCHGRLPRLVDLIDGLLEHAQRIFIVDHCRLDCGSRNR